MSSHLSRPEWERIFRRLRIVERIRPSEAHAILIWAMLAGVLGSLVALGFKYATMGLRHLYGGAGSDGYVDTFAALSPTARFLVPMCGGLCAGLILHFGQKAVRGPATDYMEAVALGDGVVPVRPSLVKSAAALFSIGSGEAIGREGPLVQLAAVSASIIGRLRGISPARLRLLVACGAAGGVAGAYNSPIAGALFVSEILLGSIAMESLGPLLLASVTATLTMRVFTHPDALYHTEVSFLGQPGEILLFGVLGLTCGCVAPLFQRILKLGRQVFRPIPGPVFIRLTLGGMVIGGLAMFWPEVTGNGQHVIKHMLMDEYTWSFLLFLLGLKLVAVAAAFGSGAVGGVFTPSLLVGATVGYVSGVFAAFLFPGTVSPPGAWAMVGMGAFLAAVTQAPIMSILMLFEMTLRHEIILPLMVATVLAYATARALRAPSLYGESLSQGPRSVFDRPLSAIRVGDIVRRQTQTVQPGDHFGEIARGFLRSPDSVRMVVGSDQRFVGIIRLAEIRSFLREPDLVDVVHARDIMHAGTPTLAPAQDLSEALRVFSENDEELLPVVESDRWIGVLSRSDLYLTLSEVTRRAAVGASV